MRAAREGGSFSSPAPELSEALGLSPFEMASGYVGGNSSAGPVRVPIVPADMSALDALEEAMLPALRRGPCFVSFSGGRDSSAILAAGVHTARRHGLDPPVPITLRFTDAPLTQESEWQERVIRELRIEDWRILEVADELDYVGPVAGEVLQRHGQIYPFNVHFYVPMLEEAGGGTILTGSAGDALLRDWRWQPELLRLTGRARLRLRTLPRLAYFAAPVPLRGMVAGWIRLSRRPWLTARAQRMFRRAIARNVDEPRRYHRFVPWIAGRRFYEMSLRSLDIVAADAGMKAEHPFLDPRFLAVVAREGGLTGFGDRTTAMRRLFGDLLPDDVLSRPTKATFGEPLFNVHTKAFLRDWDGRSPFPELVEGEGLRNAWQDGDSGTPRLLLQSTWLASARGLV